MWPNQVGRSYSGCRTSVKMGVDSTNQFIYLLSFMHLFLVFIHVMSASGLCGIIGQNLCCAYTVVWDDPA